MAAPDPVIYFFLFIMLAGIVGLITAAFQARLGLQAKQWPKTQGQVLEYLYSGSDNTPIVLKALQPFSAPSHDIQIRYEYFYEDTWHKGERVYFGKRSTGNRKRAFSYLQRFPVGSAIDVHVNPDEPKESVLIPGVGSSVIQLFMLCLIMTVLGGYLTWFIIQAA